MTEEMKTLHAISQSFTATVDTLAEAIDFYGSKDGKQGEVEHYRALLDKVGKLAWDADMHAIILLYRKGAGT